MDTQSLVGVTSTGSLLFVAIFRGQLQYHRFIGKKIDTLGRIILVLEVCLGMLIMVNIWVRVCVWSGVNVSDHSILQNMDQVATKQLEKMFM